jgi:hypothetical protein
LSSKNEAIASQSFFNPTHYRSVQTALLTNKVCQIMKYSPEKTGIRKKYFIKFPLHFLLLPLNVICLVLTNIIIRVSLNSIILHPNFLYDTPGRIIKPGRLI